MYLQVESDRICEIYYGINGTKIACDRSGSGKEKSVGIGWDPSRHKIKLRQWDTGFIIMMDNRTRYSVGETVSLTQTQPIHTSTEK